MSSTLRIRATKRNASEATNFLNSPDLPSSTGYVCVVKSAQNVGNVNFYNPHLSINRVANP